MIKGSPLRALAEGSQLSSGPTKGSFLPEGGFTSEGRETEGRAHLRLRELDGDKMNKGQNISEHCYAINSH